MKRTLLFSWRYLASWFPLFAIASLLATDALAVVTPATYGPFDINFYNAGDSFSIGTKSYTGTQNWTSEQMADISASINAWDAGIANTAGRQIRMDMIWHSFSENTLGASSSVLTSNGTSAWNYGEGVWRDGWTGGLTSSYDTRIVYDADAAGNNWNFGDDAPASNRIDFRSVASHEVGHSLGFSSTYKLSTDKFWYNGLSNWDTWLVDESGNRAKKNSTGTPGNLNQIDDPIYFDGPNAQAANGNNPVAIYAPDPFELGSSLSHLDETIFPNALMSPQIGRGQMVRAPTGLEWAMMTDMGWNVVPEPGAWVMLFGMACTWLLWRRRSLVDL